MFVVLEHKIMLRMAFSSIKQWIIMEQSLTCFSILVFSHQEALAPPAVKWFTLNGPIRTGHQEVARGQKDQAIL